MWKRVGWLASLLGAQVSPVLGELMWRSRLEFSQDAPASVPTPTQFIFHALRKAVAAASSGTAGVARDLLEHGSNDIADGHYAKRAGPIIEVAAEALDGAFLHLGFRTWGGRVSVGRVSSVSGWCSDPRAAAFEHIRALPIYREDHHTTLLDAGVVAFSCDSRRATA